jgi:hypothetical protein
MATLGTAGARPALRRIDEPLQVEAGLAGPLQADEDDELSGHRAGG